MTDHQRPSAVWGQRWLEALEQDPSFGQKALRVGERVAQVHGERDVRIGPGRAEATVTAGPRRRYHIDLFTPVLGDAAWDRFFDHVAESQSRAAGLLGGTLDFGLYDEALALGVALLPRPGEVTYTCDCDGWDAPCKHVAGALVAVADAIDDDPLLLLTLRGRTRPEIVAALDRRRPDASAPQSVDELASLAWLRPRRPLPPLAPIDAPTPGTLPVWGAPPASAPFTAQGLGLLGTDLIHRATALLAGRSPSGLDLDPLSDLARLADVFSGSTDRRRLAEHSGVAVRELAARAAAWAHSGPIGVRAHVHPIVTVRVGPDAQLRRVDHGGVTEWFRFEKRSGRWMLVDGPGDDPEHLLSADPIS